MSNFKQNLGNLIEKQHLAPYQIDTLLELQERLHPAPRKKLNRILAPGWLGMSALVAGFAALVLLLYPLIAYEPILNKIANEVAANHLSPKPMEIHRNRLTEIQPYFSKLDFRLASSRLLPQMDNQLIGGRYGIIQGVDAVQLCLGDEHGNKIQTIYQIPYQPDMFGNRIPDLDRGEKPVIVYARGIKIAIWREKGLLFAATREE